LKDVLVYYSFKHLIIEASIPVKDNIDLRGLKCVRRNIALYTLNPLKILFVSFVTKNERLLTRND